MLTTRLLCRWSVTSTSTEQTISSSPHTSMYRSFMTGSGGPTGFAGIRPGIGATGRAGGMPIIAGHSMYIAIIFGTTTIITTTVPIAIRVIRHPATTRCIAMLQQVVRTWHSVIPKARLRNVMRARKMLRAVQSATVATCSARV